MTQGNRQNLILCWWKHQTTEWFYKCQEPITFVQFHSLLKFNMLKSRRTLNFLNKISHRVTLAQPLLYLILLCTMKKKVVVSFFMTLATEKGDWKPIHTMQGNTMSSGRRHVQWSNGHSANLHVRYPNSDWLKVDFWIHGPVAADTSHSGRPMNNSLSLYDVSDATEPCIQKSTFNQSELITHAQFHRMAVGYISFRWTCIALHSMLSLASKRDASFNSTGQ